MCKKNEITFAILIFLFVFASTKSKKHADRTRKREEITVERDD